MSRQGQLDHMTAGSSSFLMNLTNLPFAQSGGELLFHLISRLYERTSVLVTTWLSGDGQASLRMPR